MKNSKGNILITLLFILIIVSVLSVGAYQLAYSATKNANYNEVSVQAQFIAKSAADLIIENIYEFREDLINSKRDKKDYDVEISYGEDEYWEAQVTVSKESDKHLNILSIATIRGKVGRAEADVILNSSTSFNILAVDNQSKVYSISEDNDGSYTASEIVIEVEYNNNGKDKSFSYPKAFAWDYKNTLILVGGGNGSKELKTLVYNINNNQWIGSEDSGGNYGGGFSFAAYGQGNSKGAFYAVEANNNGNGKGNGKVLKLNLRTMKWEDLKANAESFKGDKLAKGNNTIVLISEDKKGEIFYIDENNNESGNKTINDYGMFGTYKSIVYGKDRFVVVGYESGDYPIIIYSEDGKDWSKIKSNINSGYELNEVAWTGDKFIAVGGAGTIVKSDDGIEWSIFPREEIIKDDRLYDGGNYWYGNYTHVSGYKEYIVAVNNSEDRILISKDGGEHWNERPLTGIEGRLVDIIVFKGDGDDAPEGYSIKWKE